MSLPEHFEPILERDRELAQRHGVVFRVVSRPRGWHPDPESGVPFELPREDGTFVDPANAVAVARDLVDRDVTVLANGSGAYWFSTMPERIDSDVLERVCRHLTMTDDEIRIEQQREELQRDIEKLEAEVALAEAVAIVGACTNEEEAIERLKADPLVLSRRQARYLVGTLRLRRLTDQGHREATESIRLLKVELAELGVADGGAPPPTNLPRGHG